jgi:Tol biopolymer transport system component
MKEKFLIVMVLAIALAGCGMVEVEGEVLDPTEAMDRELNPTQVPSEAVGIEAEGSEGEGAEGLLPAPIIYLGAEDGLGVAPGKQNLWRLEVDGSTATQITDEVVPITSFAVSPKDGAIAYTTFDENDLVRIEADGSNRTVLFDGSDLSSQPNDGEWSRASNTNVAWSPDGALIAYGYGGINIISAEGGEPSVLIPDKVVTVSGQVSQESRFYRPLTWSPDGTRLLALEGYGIEGSGYAVVNVESGDVLSMGSAVLCCDPSWSLDSKSFYFSSAAFGMIVPGLWQVDAIAGEVRTIIRGMETVGLPDETGEPMVLIQSAKELRDGNLYAFTAEGTYEELFIDEETRSEIAPTLTMSRISSEGAITPLRSDVYALGEALWADDASGAVITVMAGEKFPSGTLMWLASDGSEPVILNGRGFQPKWGMGASLSSPSDSTSDAHYGVDLSTEYAGLVYSTEEGLWLVEADGRSRFLIDQPEGALSPDGSKVAYSQGEVEDLWIEDLLTGERQNLTNTPDRREFSPQWWTDQPNLLVFQSKSVEEALFGYGKPTVVNLDGSGYRVLDDQKGAPIALSPDGKTIAFGCCDGPGILYAWPEGPSIFDPAAYGVNAGKLFLPEWSPDGQKLAWVVMGQLAPGGGDFQSGIAVFDIASKTAQILHVYTPLGGSSVEYFLSWSPDGNWLAFVTYAERAELGRKPALYVTRADGQEEHFLGVGFNPIWSPDGEMFVFNEAKDSPSSIWDHIVHAVPFGDWGNGLILPIDAALQDWIER